MVYPHKALLFHNKKECNTNTCHDKGEPEKHAKWQKSDKKDHILYNSIYMKYSEKANLKKQKVDQ